MNYTAHETASLHQETFAYLKVEEKEHVLRIQLHRPAKKNALTPIMVQEFAYALSYAHHRPEVRAVVISAAGNVFCAGADLKAFMGMTEPNDSTIPPPAGEILIGELLKGLHRPCIAHVEGDVHAGGFLILAGCTHVVAARGIRLALPEVKRGIFPFQVMAGLAEIIPARKVLDWCMRGYDLDLETALEWGLVTHTAQPEATSLLVEQLLGEILEGSPSAIRMGLEAWDQLRKLPAEKHHAYLQGMLLQALQTPDAHEGIAAFREKRPPKWTGMSKPGTLFPSSSQE